MNLAQHMRASKRQRSRGERLRYITPGCLSVGHLFRGRVSVNWAEIGGKGFSELTPIVMKDERTRGLTDVSMSVIWPKHLCCAFILPIRAFGFRPWGPMLLLREGSLIERKKEEPALAVQVVQCTRAPGCHGGPWLSQRPPGVTGTPGCHGGPWVSRGPLAVVASQGPLAESESMININLLSVCNQIINWIFYS